MGEISTKIALKLGLTLQQTYFLWLIHSAKNQILECDRIYLSEKLMCSVSQISKLTRLLEEWGFILREKPTPIIGRYHLREKAQQLFEKEKNAKATKKSISKEIRSKKES
jgi:predicted transcriptional regulator